MLKSAIWVSTTLWQRLPHARGEVGVLTILHVRFVGVLHSDVVLTTKPLVGFVGILTRLHVRSELSIIGPVVSIIRSIVSFRLLAAPPLLGREYPSGLCYD